MLTFLHPFAFLALLGLLVPLAIHLWERRQGRRVLVGSIRLLEEADEQRINHLQLTDLWRLLLRALILVLFVFLLAGPVWKALPEEGFRHWVLLTPGLTVEGELQAHLDSLRAADRPVRMLAPGFPEWTPELGGAAADNTENYWSLFRELCRLPAAPDTVTIFGDPLLRHFRGDRPGLPLVVRWQPLPESGAVPFLVNAWQDDDRLEVLLGLSGAEGTVFRRSSVPALAGEHPLPEPFPALVLQPGAEPGTLEAGLSSREEEPLAVTMAPRRVIRLVHDQSQEEEGRYLQAALRAAAAFTGLEIDIQSESAEGFDKAAADDNEWLFWLPQRPLPPSVAGAWAPALVEYRPSSLYRERYLRKEAGGLVLQRKLAPEGPDLRIDERLPAELIGLLFAEERQYAEVNDQRFLAEEQLPPVFTAGKEERISSDTELHGPLWLLLLLLFLLERLLAARPEWRKSSH